MQAVSGAPADSEYISGPSSEWPSVIHWAQSPLPSFQIPLAVPSVPSSFLLVQNTASSLVEIQESRDSQCDHLPSSLLVFLPYHSAFWVTTQEYPDQGSAVYEQTNDQYNSYTPQRKWGRQQVRGTSKVPRL